MPASLYNCVCILQVLCSHANAAMCMGRQMSRQTTPQEDYWRTLIADGMPKALLPVHMALGNRIHMEFMQVVERYIAITRSGLQTGELGFSELSPEMQVRYRALRPSEQRPPPAAVASTSTAPPPPPPPATVPATTAAPPATNQQQDTSVGSLTGEQAQILLQQLLQSASPRPQQTSTPLLNVSMGSLPDNLPSWNMTPAHLPSELK